MAAHFHVGKHTKKKKIVVVLHPKGHMYMGKLGSICHFPRALPASI